MKEKIKKFFLDFWEEIKRPEMAVLPGQLAFFLALSIVPTVTLIAFFATRLNLPMDYIYTFLTKMFNKEVANMIVPTLSSAHTIKLVIYLCIGYFIASNGAASLIVTSNAIYKIPNSNYFKRRLKAIIMTVILVVLFLFILIVPVFSNKIVDLFEYIEAPSRMIKNMTLFFKIFKGPLSWFIMFLLIKLIYTLAPDRDIKSEYVNYGAIFTTIMWVIATSVYSYYVNHLVNYNAFYGGAANIVILLLWLYLLSYIFVIGMALNYRKETIKLSYTSDIPYEEVKERERNAKKRKNGEKKKA